MASPLTGWWGFLKGCAYAVLRHNPSSIAQELRSRIYRTDCKIDTGVVITAPAQFACGEACALYHGTYILNGNGHIHMGDRSHLGAMCYVNVFHGEVRIGNDVAIGPHTDIIAYSNHYEAEEKITDCRTQEDISLGDNVFIGAHSTLLPGTQIEDNVVVGAGSVVKGRLDTNSVYAGTPCRKIREGWYE